MVLKNEESFTYTINSNQKVNSGLSNYYDIDIGGFNTSYNNFLVEVLHLGLGPNNSVLTSKGHIILIAEDFAENENFVNPLLNTNDMIIGVINTTSSSLDASTGIIFKSKNLRMKRRVRFQFRNLDLSSTTSGTEINVGSNETLWNLVLKLIPIE